MSATDETTTTTPRIDHAGDGSLAGFILGCFAGVAICGIFAWVMIGSMTDQIHSLEKRLRDERAHNRRMQAMQADLPGGVNVGRPGRLPDSDPDMPERKDD